MPLTREFLVEQVLDEKVKALRAKEVIALAAGDVIEAARLGQLLSLLHEINSEAIARFAKQPLPF